MGTYLTPADIWVSATWQDHKDRNPPSNEPGTDYATAYGTDLRVAEAGRISVIDTNPDGGEGRRLSIDLDDGRRISYLHLSEINSSARVGHAVRRGQTQLMWSGASGYGNNWHYGSHVHVSLWERPGMAYKDTIDFQQYVGDPPVPPEPPKPKPVGGEMILIHNASNPSQYILVTADGGHLRGRFLEDPYERAVFLSTFPALPVTACDDETFNGFLSRIGYVYGSSIPLVPMDVADVSIPISASSNAGKTVARAGAALLILTVLALIAGRVR